MRTHGFRTVPLVFDGVEIALTDAKQADVAADAIDRRDAVALRMQSIVGMPWRCGIVATSFTKSVKRFNASPINANPECEVNVSLVDRPIRKPRMVSPAE